MKRLVLSLFSVVLFASSFLGAAPFITIGYDQEYIDAFMRAKTNGITTTATADSFGPWRNLTRQEWSKFVGNFGEDFLCLEANLDINCSFTDSSNISTDLQNSVTKACLLGLMKGNGGRFFPNTFVSKAQVLATMVRGMADQMDETIDPRYLHYHTYALANDITTVTDVDTFDRPVSRYEALLMLYRARGFECNGGLTATGTTTTGSITTGTMATGVNMSGSNNTGYINNTGSMSTGSTMTGTNTTGTNQNTTGIILSGNVTIAISGFAYNPQTITVAIGTIITWVNKDSVQHTITSSSGTQQNSATWLSSPLLSQGDSFAVEFSHAGSFEYRCLLHSGMTGEIIVASPYTQ